MSVLNVGDKVKFLNASGGGVVAKLIDSRTVSVLIEDGFEIPTLISELIRIVPDVPAARFFNEDYKVKLEQEENGDEDDEVQESATDNQRRLPAYITRNRQSEDIFLAFVPHDQKWLITGVVDILLINNSSFDVLYNIFRKTPLNHYEGVDYGNVFPDSSLLLDTINREQLSRWTEGYIQFLFHRQQSSVVLPPFNSEFRIDGKKFFKEGNYREHPVTGLKGIVVKVLSLTQHLQEPEPKDQAPQQEQQREGNLAEKPLIMKHVVEQGFAEVDLHIHELIDDPANLEKTEILEFQLAYFRKCLDNAIAHHINRIVFIHGVGNGILRERVIAELKKNGGIEFFDAPMSKYGVGALEVRIPQNR